MLGAKEMQLLIGLPDFRDESVQYSGVRLHYKLYLVARILWDKGALGPGFVVLPEAAIPAFFLYSIGQHPVHPFETKLLQHLFGTVRIEVHSIKLLPDSLLNGLLTCDIGLVAGPPESNLIAAFGSVQSICIEVGVIPHGHPPVPGAGASHPDWPRSPATHPAHPHLPHLGNPECPDLP